MASRASNESDRADAIVQLLSGLANGTELFEIAAVVADIHPKNDTFPGEVYLRLASDALALADAGSDHPIGYRSLVEDYLSECDFRGWDKRKIQYAILASGALRGGIEPDLLTDTAWRTDDFWRYALFAVAAVVRPTSARLGVPVAEFAERLAQHHGLELS
jgi:hypothetical protein